VWVLKSALLEIVAPTGNGYTKIYSNRYAFAALTTNGSIKAWGDWDWGGTHAPSGSGYTKRAIGFKGGKGILS
jgi:hypothetical protein